MTTPKPDQHPVGLAIWLILAAVVGWWAAAALLLERLRLLADPDAAASCDFSVLIQCGKNLDAWQGSVFGFPNPVIGVAAWIAPLVVGVAILAGARFARWFWGLFLCGLAAAFVFVVWLIGQSIFVLGTLCPWCMVTWIVTIPSFYAVLLHTLRSGLLPADARIRRGADVLMGWMPLLAVASYAVIAIIAQLRLDVIGSLA